MVRCDLFFKFNLVFAKEGKTKILQFSKKIEQIRELIEHGRRTSSGSFKVRPIRLSKFPVTFSLQTDPVNKQKIS